jgi:phytoene desaturase
MSMTAKRVIVVGAGPGGLTASMLLASKGYDVTVFEKRAEVGGRNSALHIGDYTFDVGPTFLLMKDVLEGVFKQAGKDVHAYMDIRELDPMYRLLFKGGRALYPSRDREKMKATLEAFSPGSSAGYLRYLDKERRKYNQLIPCLQMPYGRIRDFFSWQLISSIPYLDAHTSIYNVLARYFDNDDTRIAFTFQAKYIGMSPWEAPGTFSIISFIEHGDGIFHVMGGLNQLSQGMAKAAREAGAKIRTSAPVRRVLIENRTAVGVELEDGGIERADYVIVNADFAQAMTKLVSAGDRRKWTDTHIASRRYSCSTFMLYLGVNRRYEDIPHHSIIFAEDYRRNIDDIVRTGTLSSDLSFYVQNASVTDPSLAPAGKSALYVLVPVPNNASGIDWQKEAGPFRERVLDLIESRGGYKDLRSHIEVERMITPADWEQQMDVYRGATFNLAHNVSQMLYFRPHNEFEDFRNCYLVGGGTHPGSGLPTIYESGRISAELIMKRDGVPIALSMS